MSKQVDHQKPSMLGKIMFACLKAVGSLLMLPIDALRYKMAKPEQKPARKTALMNRLPGAAGAVVGAMVLVAGTNWVKYQVESGVDAAQKATHDIADEAGKLADKAGKLFNNSTSTNNGGVTTTQPDRQKNSR